MHKNWVIFAVIIWHRKSTMRNSINVSTGKRIIECNNNVLLAQTFILHVFGQKATNVDPSEFETFQDASSKFVEASETAKRRVRNTTYSVRENNDVTEKENGEYYGNDRHKHI